MYFVKIGSLYLGRNGSLTDRQTDALRVDDNVRAQCIDDFGLTRLRLVHLKQRSVQDDDTSVPPADDNPSF